MPKRTRRRAAKPAPTEKPAADATPKTEGQALMAELEARCGVLGAWHRRAAEALGERQRQLDEFAEAVTVEKDQLKLEADRLETERAALADARRALQADRDQTAALREQIDEEWDTLRGLRQAQEKLGKELDRERQRQNQAAFKLPAGTSRGRARKAA
ncbi:MAG: hypothetical protein AAF710_06775 [Planctomycetota bacterium]